MLEGRGTFLSDATEIALDYLSANENGFFFNDRRRPNRLGWS